jgi:hypothetical protein
VGVGRPVAAPRREKVHPAGVVKPCRYQYLRSPSHSHPVTICFFAAGPSTSFRRESMIPLSSKRGSGGSTQGPKSGRSTNSPVSDPTGSGTSAAKVVPPVALHLEPASRRRSCVEGFSLPLDCGDALCLGTERVSAASSFWDSSAAQADTSERRQTGRPAGRPARRPPTFRPPYTEPTAHASIRLKKPPSKWPPAIELQADSRLLEATAKPECSRW